MRTRREQAGLSSRRKQILEYIADYTERRGYPPSLREIANAVGLASPSTVHAHIAVLERQGYLERGTAKPRAIGLVADPIRLAASGLGALRKRPLASRSVPLVGSVAAGPGAVAEQRFEEEISLPGWLEIAEGVFGLTVRGDSMIEMGILDGDVVLVRPQPTAEAGDLVVAGVGDEEATVKRYFPKGEVVHLVPANREMQPIVVPASQIRIFGKVVGLIRQY
jgi:repressor LexA